MYCSTLEFTGKCEACGSVKSGFRTPTSQLTEKQNDPVNHPKHYNSHPSGVECIEIIRHHSCNIGNVIKYLWRAGLKDPAKEIEDMEKAMFYLKDEIERIKNEQAKNR